MSTSTSATTSSTTSTGGTVLRITGMVSGLDVDATVSKLMAVEQLKLDSLKQAQQLTQWKQTDYNSIITSIKDLQSSFMDVASPSTNVLSQSNYSANNVTIGSDSTSSISATSGSGAATGNYSVNYSASGTGTMDGSIASVASVSGNDLVQNTSGVYVPVNWSGKNIGFSVNGNSDQVITLSASDTDINKTVSDINAQINANSSLSGNLSAVVAADGKSIQFQALSDASVKISNSTTTVNNDLDKLKGIVINPSLDTTMGDLGITTSSTLLKLNYNNSSTPVTVTINSTDKLSDVISNISKTTSGAVTASFSQLTGQFSIQSATTGAAQNINIVSGLSNFGIGDGTTKSGTDAVVYITPPGSTIATRVEKPTNSFTIDGVSYNLLKASNSSFTISSDTTKVHDQVKSFLDKYNAIIDTIQTKLGEKTDSAYPPLTDTQKSSMSAADIATWNTKAQVGDLRNDTNLQNLLTSLRQAFTTPLQDSSGNSVSSVNFGNYGTGAIGIDTSDDSTQGDKITIVDDAKFTAAIAANPNGVMKLFTNTSTAATGSTANFNESGIFQRLNNILVSNVGYTGTTLNTATLTQFANVQDDYSSTGSGSGSTIPDQIYHEQLQITNQTTAMSAKSEAYYMQFSNLETALSTLNSQSSILTQLTSTSTS